MYLLYLFINIGYFRNKLTVFVTAIMFCGAAASCSESGTTLSAYVSANDHYQKEYKWTINKTVTPDTFKLNDTETGTSQYYCFSNQR